jgi:predicted Rossmann fold flavoprotein
LFTHWGLSGPAVLKLSAWAARWLKEKEYDFKLLISFMDSLNEEDVRNKVSQIAGANVQKRVINTPINNIPSRLWERLCLLSDIHDEMKWTEAGKSRMNKLIERLIRFEVHVKGKTTFKEEFVTCGGINLKEVEMKTMESKLHKGLYFAGEVLNIDGITGGFNFQSAWTTGWIAGGSAGEQ